MGVWEEHGMTSYPDYWNTEWWKTLKDLLIYSNPKVGCYICGRRNTMYHITNRKSLLLIHHISYDNLFKEKLNKDIFIICHDCHRRCHYWVILLFGEFRVPRTNLWLLFSLRMRVLQYFTQKRQFSLALVYFLGTLITAIYHLTIYLSKSLIVILWKMLVFILGLAFQ